MQPQTAWLIQVFDPSRQKYEYYLGFKRGFTEDPHTAQRFLDPFEAKRRIETLRGKISIYTYKVVPAPKGD